MPLDANVMYAVGNSENGLVDFPNIWSANVRLLKFGRNEHNSPVQLCIGQISTHVHKGVPVARQQQSPHFVFLNLK